ncbi:hypothetical protein MOV08_05310 [Streptomyces yunnanensis]|uniref:Uncharacterized protein n=1 Tax=Streptomyces yunnanensis TaxID=156453 RepID=A0ABY8A265_9ACTN|nr:hypothetical protein [Streptomyces yunnanensis]WEB38779.1 hypothetical protein MOV08_05310 [Streptomyces yunnanensis]
MIPTADTIRFTLLHPQTLSRQESVVLAGLRIDFTTEPQTREAILARAEARGVEHGGFPDEYPDEWQTLRIHIQGIPSAKSLSLASRIRAASSSGHSMVEAWSPAAPGSGQWQHTTFPWVYWEGLGATCSVGVDDISVWGYLFSEPWGTHAKLPARSNAADAPWVTVNTDTPPSSCGKS